VPEQYIKKYITIHFDSILGYYAALMGILQDKYGWRHDVLIIRGINYYESNNEAVKKAKEWARSEGIKYVPNLLEIKLTKKEMQIIDLS